MSMRKLILHIKDISPEDLDYRDLKTILDGLDKSLKDYAKDKTISVVIKESSASIEVNTPDEIGTLLDGELLNINQGQSPVILLPLLNTIEQLIQQKNYQITMRTDNKDLKEIQVNTLEIKEKKDLIISTQDYVYGIIVQAGGKNQATIHIDSPEHNKLIVASIDKDLLRQQNWLYKDIGTLLSVKIKYETGEILEAQVLEIWEYKGRNEEEHLKILKEKIQQATGKWKDVNVQEFINKLRNR